MKSLSRTVIHFILFLVLVAFTNSCTEEVQQSLRPVPTAFGEINELTIIADRDVWESPLGDTTVFYYSSAFPILPQPESLLDLRYFTPGQVKEDILRREFRTYLVIGNLENPESETLRLMKEDVGEGQIEQLKANPKNNIIIGRDKWAKDQLLIYQFGRNYDELIENLKNNFPVIFKKIKDHDRKKIDIGVYLEGRNEKIEQEIRDKMGINIRIPEEYFQAISDGEIIWVRKETTKLSSNLIIKKLPYRDPKQLTHEGIKAIRDEIGRKYVSTRIKGSYMHINDEDLPMFTNPVTLDNKYAIESRGIWEIVNDYMGGPFVSYLVLNPKTNELIFIDGFVHAPGEDKRNFIIHLDHIINTVKIP